MQPTINSNEPTQSPVGQDLQSLGEAATTILNVRFDLPMAGVVLGGNDWFFTFDDTDAGLSNLDFRKKHTSGGRNTIVAFFKLVSLVKKADTLPYRPFRIAVDTPEELWTVDPVLRKEILTALLHRMRCEMEIRLRQTTYRQCDPMITTARFVNFGGNELASVPHSFFVFTPCVG